MYILYYKENNNLKVVDKNDVMDDLYYLKARVPREKDIEATLQSSTKEIKNFFIKYDKIKDAIEEIKQSISEIDVKIPLYDEYSKNLYIINRDNVYSRVVYNHYRFPDKVLFDILKKRKKKLEDKVKNITNTEKIQQNLSEFDKDYKIHYQLQSSSYFVIREYRKLSLMIKFLESFDLDTLETTYIKVFYYYSNEVGKNITVCKRPSFLPHFKHISPYYTRSELINLALNFEIIKPSDKYYTPEDILKLCDVIKKNDINKKILLEHQRYIINNDKIGIIQYYTLQGSFYMNQYMRGFSSYKFKNELLEDNIKSMWKLINESPEFDKSYTLYRFVKNDPHLKDIPIGGNYVESGFTSTTRNPFYRSDIYKFGFILIKIKIPKGIKGVALCVETVSQFPDEQEIILSPGTILRLDRKDENCPFFHIDDNYETKIRTRYEFTYIGKEEIKMPNRELYLEPKVDINFLKIKQIDSITMEERIRYFVNEYVNPMYQFSTRVGDKSLDLIVEWYDSTGAYKKFYSAKSDNGFSIYTIIDNYIAFVIELGEEANGPYMNVNYYFQFSTTNRNKTISDNDFLQLLAKIGYYFKVKYIKLYADYTSCDLIPDKKNVIDVNNYQGGNFCTDFYNYFKNGKRRYGNVAIDKTVFYPGFNYYDLDLLKKTDPLKIITKNDGEIYQIYVKTYQPFVDKDKQDIADFYLYLIDHHCIHINDFSSKIDRIFKNTNSFQDVFYVLDGLTYLYNEEIISYIPSYDDISYEDQEIAPTKHAIDYKTSNERYDRLPRSRLIDSVLEVN